jgi:hypothetical protein
MKKNEIEGEPKARAQVEGPDFKYISIYVQEKKKLPGLACTVYEGSWTPW